MVGAFAIAACGSDDTADPADTEPTSTAEADSSATTDLTIRYQAPQADIDVTYSLVCSSDGATIDGDDVDVTAEAACAALDDQAVFDRLVDGVPQDQMCTEQFGGEDIATIRGTLGAAAVDTTVDRTNGCGISTWDELLSALLPPAVGVR